MDEELDPILIQVCIPLPIPMIYSGFTDPTHVRGWLADSATIEPKKGGTYRLGWTEPVTFESDGEVPSSPRTWTSTSPGRVRPSLRH